MPSAASATVVLHRSTSKHKLPEPRAQRCGPSGSDSNMIFLYSEMPPESRGVSRSLDSEHGRVSFFCHPFLR